MLTAYAQQVLDDNPSGYWRLNESNLTTAAIASDSSGNGFDARYFQKFPGSLTSSAIGSIGDDADPSVSFNANADNTSGGAVVIPSAIFNFPPAIPAGNAPATNRSIEVWFKTTPGGKGIILGQVGGGLDVNPELVASGFVPTIYVDGTGTVRAEMFWHNEIVQLASASGYNDAQWHYVVFTETNTVPPSSSVASTFATLYVDGISNGQSGSSVVSRFGSLPAGYAANYSYYLGTGPFAARVGLTNNAWSYFQGNLDEFAVYPTTLTPAQILNHYLAGFGQEFSDADPSYGTAQHLAKGPTLGSLRDVEAAAPVGSGNLSDDNSYLDDEDGLLTNQIVGGQALAQIRYSVQNVAPGKQAYVGGWLDYNRNGTFDVNELVLNNVVSSNGEYTFSTFVPPSVVSGQYTLRLRVSSTPLTSPIEPAPDLSLRTLKLNIQNRVPDFTRLTPSIDFGAGTEVIPGNGAVLNRAGSEGNIFGGIGVAPFAVNSMAAVWSGKLQVPLDGEYQFTLRSDDGMIMYLDEGLIVNSNSLQGATNRSGKIWLKAGFHDLIVAGTEAAFDAVFQASWERTAGASTFPRTIIPASALYNDMQVPGQFVSGGLRGDFYALTVQPINDDALLKPVPLTFVQRDGEAEDHTINIQQQHLVVSNINDAGPGSLRAAIEEANSISVGHEITFNLPAGHQVIQLQTALPALTGHITIRGPSGPAEMLNGSGNQLAMLELRGLANDLDAPANMHGLQFDGIHVSLSGLAITNFSGSGVVVRAARANIENLFIGTNHLQMTGIGNRQHGVLIDRMGTSNEFDNIFVGTLTPYSPDVSEFNERRINATPSNVISGNRGDGIRVKDSARVYIGNNRIGTTLDGRAMLPNLGNGVTVDGPHVFDVEIGNFNFIGGNTQHGVLITQGTPDVVVVDNRIGVDVTGLIALPNGQDGIRMESFETTVVRNVVSGNLGSGITVDGPLDVPSGIVGWWTGDSPNDSLGRENLTAEIRFDSGCDCNFPYKYFEARSNVSTVSEFATVELGPGKVGRGLVFRGIEPLLPDLPEADHLQSMTLELWASFENENFEEAPGNEEILVQKAFRSSTPSNTFGWSLFRGGDGSLKLLLPQGRVISSAADLIGDADRFYHLALVRDQTTIRLYIDGTMEIEAELLEHELDWIWDGPASFGGDVNGGYLTGTLDEISLYQRALSDDELLEIYDADELGKPKPAMANLVLKNGIGTSSDGAQAVPNIGDGVHASGDVRRLWIDRNTISGNDGLGVHLQVMPDAAFELLYLTEPNVAVRSNRIGTSIDGNTALPNVAGIHVESDMLFVGIRNDDLDLHPVISGNQTDGIVAAPGVRVLEVKDAYVGLNAAGIEPIANGGFGLRVVRDDTLASDSSISVTGSTISANGSGGISVLDRRELVTESRADFTFPGNRVGLRAVGTIAAGNGNFGIKIEAMGPLSPTIGSAVLTDNTISGNKSAIGVWLLGTHSWDLSRSRIGTDPTGNIAIPNAIGLRLENTADIVLPDTLLVSGNSEVGVSIVYNLRQATSLELNMLVGTDLKGTRAIGNGTGVEVNIIEPDFVGPLPEDSIYEVTIGGVISGNRNSGISIRQADHNSSLTISALIGVNKYGDQPLSNGTAGISVQNSATTVTINPEAVIAYNRGPGVDFANGDDATNFRLSVEQEDGPTEAIARIYGNRGLAVDTQALFMGTEIESAELIDGVLQVTGSHTSPRKFIQFFATHPTLNGFGQGQTPIGRFGLLLGPDEEENDLFLSAFYELDIEEPLLDFDPREDHFEFSIPVDEDFSARLLTSVTVDPVFGFFDSQIGRLSEFSQYVSIGTQQSALARKIDAGGDLTLFTDETLSRRISFRDDDSVEFSIEVNYGEGDDPQPLVWERVDRSLLLEHQFRKAGNYPVTVSVLDDSTPAGQLVTDTIQVTVLNRPPEIEFNQQQLTKRVNEGQLVEILGYFTDSGIDDQHTVTVSWGDESTSNAAIQPTGEPGRWSYTSSHIYQDDGSSFANSWAYRVVTNVIDEFGAEAKTPVFLVEVDNVNPSSLNVELNRDSFVEGETVELSATFLEPGLLDTHDVFITWGDGTQRERIDTVVQLGTLRSFQASHRYADDAGTPYLVTVEISDDDDPFRYLSTSRSVVVLNAPPAIVAVESSSPVDEGDALVLFVAWNDAGIEAHTVEVNWNVAENPDAFVAYSVAAGKNDVSLVHSYTSDGTYLVAVRLSDNAVTTNVRTLLVDVLNFAPLAANLSLFQPALTPGGPTIPVSGVLLEGSEVILLGSIVDLSPTAEVYTVSIDWGDGTTSPAEVDSANKSFTARHRFDDDPSGPNSRYTIVATASDGTESVVSPIEIEIQNAVPILSIVPQIDTAAGHPTFRAMATDRSLADQANLLFNWTLTKGATAILFDGQLPGQPQGGPLVSFDPNTVPTGGDPLVLSLVVNDDDGGQATYQAVLYMGTSGNDRLTLTNTDVTLNGLTSPLATGFTKLLLLGLNGNDVLDGSLVTNAALSLQLFGGQGNDQLFGGSGHDVAVLGSGNDSLNDPNNTLGIVLNMDGNDHTYVIPNSVLRVFDDKGQNTLDFSLADSTLIAQSGVTFDLSLTPGSVEIGTVAIAQDIAPQSAEANVHFVAALGSFSTLIGSNYGDTLTGASNAQIFGGNGADNFFTRSNLRDAAFHGGQDADVLSARGINVINIRFDGDDGADQLLVEASTQIDGQLIFGGGHDADVLINRGRVSHVIFEGGADADVLQHLSGRVTQIDFEGDTGIDSILNTADIFWQAGDDPALRDSAGLTFAGGSDADVLINRGRIAQVVFDGGADADTLVSELGRIARISFSGDDGADQIVIEANTTIGWTAGDDPNLQSIQGIQFTGGNDADVLINRGSITRVIFDGGADADVLQNQRGRITNIDFDGDAGADLLINESDATIEWQPGDDANLKASQGVNFVGGQDADVLINRGRVAVVVFDGGADADVLQNLSGRITQIDFEGDDGADLLINEVDAIVQWTSGDAAELQLLSGINFRGGNDADVLINRGRVTQVVFDGGADADVLQNLAGRITRIDFEGDDGADSLINAEDGIVQWQVGDDPLLRSNQGINFEGGADADVLINRGRLARVYFDGGADADVLVNTAGRITRVEFDGDAGADLLINESTIRWETGDDSNLSNQQGIVFRGGDDADVLINRGRVSTIQFDGGADSDHLSHESGEIDSLSFNGGADADVLVSRSKIRQVDFDGDTGDDTLFLASVEYPDIFTTATFNGGPGCDLLISEASLSLLTFLGGEGDDVLQLRGGTIRTLTFDGQQGRSTFVNRASQVNLVDFIGDDQADIFINRGRGGDANFQAGDGDDVFVNSAYSFFDSGRLVFAGEEGSNAMRNDGRGWERLEYSGGDGEDFLQNNSFVKGELEFVGGNGTNAFENNADRHDFSGTRFGKVTLSGGDGDDTFANDGASLAALSVTTQLGDDTFINTGSNVSLIFIGGSGDDRFYNSGQGLSSQFFGEEGDDAIFNRGPDTQDLTFYAGTGLNKWINYASAEGSVLIDGQGNENEIPSLQFSAVNDSTNIFINYASRAGLLNFGGGAGDDQLQNFGSETEVYFSGAQGNNALLNAGRDSTIRFVGGAGDDQLENRAEGASIEMYSREGNNTLVQRANEVDSVALYGEGGYDWLLNYGDDVLSLTLAGGGGDDLLQNSGDFIQTVTLYGGSGNNTLQNFGSHLGILEVLDNVAYPDSRNRLDNSGDFIQLIQSTSQVPTTFVSRGNNVQAIRMNGSPQNDSADIQGNNLRDIILSSGAGNDTLRVNTESPLASIGVFTALGDDLFAFAGTALAVQFNGGEGDDQAIYSGETISTVLAGSDGNDLYRFDGGKGFIRIEEASSLGAVAGTAVDTLDFSGRDMPISLDLALTTPQILDDNRTTIMLSHAQSIEHVIGTAYADTILGNLLSNNLSGAEYFSGDVEDTEPIEFIRSQWVLLDFASSQEPGNYVYTQADAQQLKAGLEEAYSGFNVFFAIGAEALPEDIRHDASKYATIVFNRTPDSGRPGGDSSEIDFGNVRLDGTASVQVNGLLGGREVLGLPGNELTQASEGDEIAAPDIPKPASTISNFLALSTKIAAHELAHLLGVRHYDAFGPIGLGVHVTPGVDSFKPTFSGMEAGFESVDHIISSPASLGTTRFNDLRKLVFGAREATKLAIAMSDADELRHLESATQHSSLELATPVSLSRLTVPNLALSGLNVGQTFGVRAAAIVGSIGLTTQHTSENDWYSFSGNAGDVITVEVMSRALRRYFTSNATSIDPVIRLYDQAGQLVSLNGFDAANDDEFETSDALLMDVTLPESGSYYLEVDTFRRLASDASYPNAVALRQLLEERQSNDDPSDDLTSTETEVLQRLVDSLDDTDIGNYELLIYAFQSASAEDGIDDLQGRQGVDHFAAGSDDSYELQIELAGPDLALEGSAWSGVYSFVDRGGFEWTATLDWGDGSTPESWAPSADDRGSSLPISHVFQDNGTYLLTLEISNDDGLVSLTTHTILVNNVAPTVFLSGPTSGSPGSEIQYQVVATDPAGDADALTVDWVVTRNNLPFATQHGGSSLTLNPSQAGTYDISVTVNDGDAGIVIKNLKTFVFAFDVATAGVQRSWIESVDMIFGSPEQVTLIKDNPSRLKLTRFDLAGPSPDGSGGALVNLNNALVANGNNLKLAFGSSVIGTARNSTAADGYYRIELDLDGDGQMDAVRHFYRLLGDVNGDHKVDAVDANLILAGMGKPFNRDLDINGDGVINGTDRIWTQRSNGRKLKEGLFLDD